MARRNNFKPWKCDARVALDLLCARYNIDKRGRASKRWPVHGNTMQFNSQITPKTVDRLLKKIVARHDHSGRSACIKWIDVGRAHADGVLWYLQRTIKFPTIRYLLRRGWDWNTKFSRFKLPIYLYYRKKIIVWNGTHRTILSILAGRRVRVRVLDLNDFLAWEKRNPDKSKWNIRRVVKVRGKRRG